MNFLKTILCLVLPLNMAVLVGGQRAQRLGAGNSLTAKIRRFAPTTLTANTATLSPGDRKALAKIIEAAKLLDPLFLRQVWSGND